MLSKELAEANPPETVFTFTRTVVNPRYLLRIPDSIDTKELLGKACKTFCLTFDNNNQNEEFSIEGPWENIIELQDFLLQQLKEWDNQILTSEPEHGILCTEQEVEPSELPSLSTFDCDENLETLCASELQSDLLVDGSADKNESNHENEIYMDIKLSCRPQNGLFKESGTTPVTVVMRTDESLLETVCLESASDKDNNFEHIIDSKLDTIQNSINNIDDWKKARSKIYEERAQFKFFCNQCSFKSKRHSHLKKHALLHERVCKLYSCDHCDFSTIRLGHLQRHIIRHSELRLTCSLCNYKTHSPTLLRRHQNVKHTMRKLQFQGETPKFNCTECSYSTTREKFFQRHNAVHEGSKNSKKGGKGNFECCICSFKTTSKSNLARHTNNIHGSDRPFLCNICGQGFKRSDTLSQHLVVHASTDTAMKELQCPHCHKFYRSKSLLHEHILVHSDTRSYLCEICGAAFKTRAVQQKHVRTVHIRSNVFPCTICTKKFNSKFAVKRHMKLHEPKTVSAVINKSKRKPKENSSVAVTGEWTDSVVTLPAPEDVQVLVVQENDVQQGVLFSDGAIFVQDTTQVETVTTSDPSKAINIPVLPAEYVLPEVMTSQICTTTDLGTQFTMQDGEVITFQFVQ